MVCCNQEFIPATCQMERKWEIEQQAESNHATVISPHTGQRSATPCIQQGPQAPVSQQFLSDMSLLFLHLYCPVSPSCLLTLVLVLWVSLFHSFSLTWTVSLSEPLALSRQTSTLLLRQTDREEGKKREEKLEKERIVCQYHPFVLLGK